MNEKLVNKLLEVLLDICHQEDVIYQDTAGKWCFCACGTSAYERAEGLLWELGLIDENNKLTKKGLKIFIGESIGGVKE